MKKMIITLIIACTTMILSAQQNENRWKANLEKSRIKWKKKQAEMPKIEEPPVQQKSSLKSHVQKRWNREVQSVRNIQWRNKK